MGDILLFDGESRNLQNIEGQHIIQTQHLSYSIPRVFPVLILTY